MKRPAPKKPRQVGPALHDAEALQVLEDAQNIEDGEAR
jgi:hypothetical protein